MAMELYDASIKLLELRTGFMHKVGGSYLEGQATYPSVVLRGCKGADKYPSVRPAQRLRTCEGPKARLEPSNVSVLLVQDSCVDSTTC